jgi:hypothetical protein
MGKQGLEFLNLDISGKHVNARLHCQWKRNFGDGIHLQVLFSGKKCLGEIKDLSLKAQDLLLHFCGV